MKTPSVALAILFAVSLFPACARSGDDSGTVPSVGTTVPGDAAPEAAEAAPSTDVDGGASLDGAPPSDAGVSVDATDAFVCQPVSYFTQFGLAACDQCLTATCCEDSDTCLNDTDCSALLDCVITQSSADGGDAQQCAGQHPASVTRFNAMAKCVTGACKTPCTG